jgi:hypothetical protein
MSEWIDFGVYAALILAVWGRLPVVSSRFTLPVVADRNPEWVAAHPAAAQRLADNRWFRRSCVLWGTVSLAALLAVQAEVWWPPLVGSAMPKWEALKDTNSTLLIAGLLYLLGCGALFGRWLHTHVPLAPRRQATLERRSADDYVPRPVQYGIYALVGVHLTAWLIAAALGRYTAPAFWGMLAFQFVISGIFLLLALVAVRRRPDAIDRIFGPGYRRMEVRWAFGVQVLPLMNGAVRLYEQTAGPTPADLNRAMHLGLVLLVLVMAGGLGLFSTGRRGEAGARSAAPSRSAGTLAIIAVLTVIPTILEWIDASH